MSVALLAVGTCTGGCGSHHAWWVTVIIVVIAVAIAFFRVRRRDR